MVRVPLWFKIATASFLVVLAVLGFVGTVEYRDLRQALETRFGLVLQHTAQTLAQFLDGDAHERVRTNADAATADFASLRAALDRVRRANDLPLDHIYTLRPDGRGALEFVVMLQDRTFVGDRYAPPPATLALIEAVLRDGRPRHSPIFQNEQHGAWLSAWAPVRAGDGRIVGILDVDYDVGPFLAELRQTIVARAWIVPAALGLALALSFVVARSVTRAMRTLVDATVAVRDGRYDSDVVVRTRDEVRTLADNFNLMLAGLRERFAMLRFVPRHTRAVIAESVRGAADTAFVAQKREATIFFSDIRGFTSISDRLAPARVIEMLNLYLREEARILERHHGSVDKYIGDAVMAIFEGPDRFRDAALAAVEIQRTLAGMNARRVFEEPVEVGIGIAGGEVVMGSVGYEQRMEFAVIGRLVNLASRLTSVAGRGEIVVSEAAWEALSVGGEFAGDRMDGIRLKGFAAEVTCYKLRPAENHAVASSS